MQSKPISYSFGSRGSPPREDRPAETAAEWFAERRQEGEGVEEDTRLYGYNPAVDTPQDNRFSTGGVVAYPLRRPGGGNNRGDMENGNGGSVGNPSPAGGVNTRGLTSKKPRSPPETKNQPERRFGPKVMARSRSATDFGSGKMGGNNAASHQGPRSRSPSNARPKTDDSRPFLPATEAAFKRILARQQQQQQEQQRRAKSPEIVAMKSKVEGDTAEDVAVGAESAGDKNQSMARPGRVGGGGGGRNGQEEGLPRLLTRPSASLRAAAAAGGGGGGPENGGRSNGDEDEDIIVEGNGNGGNRHTSQHSYRRQNHDGRRSSAGKVSGVFDSGISVINVGGIPIRGAEDIAGGGSGSGGSGGGNGVESGSAIGAGEGVSGDGSGSGGGVGNDGGNGGEIAAGSGIGGKSLDGAGGGNKGGVGIDAYSSEKANDGVGGGGTPPGTTVTVETEGLGNKFESSGSSRVSMEGTKGIVARRLAAFDPFSFSKQDASSGPFSRDDPKGKTYRARF